METEEQKARKLAIKFVSDCEKSEGKEYSTDLKNKMVVSYIAGFLHIHSEL